jgi:hypothetical protein
VDALVPAFSYLGALDPSGTVFYNTYDRVIPRQGQRGDQHLHPTDRLAALRARLARPVVVRDWRLLRDVNFPRAPVLVVVGLVVGFGSLVTAPVGLIMMLAAGLLFAIRRPPSARAVEVGVVLTTAGATTAVMLAVMLALVLVSAARDPAVTVGPNTNIALAVSPLVALAGLGMSVRARPPGSR